MPVLVRSILCLCAAVGVVLSSTPAEAQQRDNEIRVLAVYSAPAAPHLSRIHQELNGLSQAWLSTRVSIPVRIANGGAPLLSSLPGLPAGPPATQLAWAYGAGAEQMQALRNRHAADVVLLFVVRTEVQVGPTTKCGATREIFSMRNGFVPFGPFPDLDLRGAESHYVSVVHVGGACSFPVGIAAHEFGHQLGMGHHPRDLEPGGGLYPDSLGHIEIQIRNPRERDPRFEPRDEFGTRIARCTLGVTTECDLIPDALPRRELRYSDGSRDNAYNNVRAFRKTASSVANYRYPETPAPPLPPTAVLGRIVAHCDPPPYTRHQIDWVPNPNNDPRAIVGYEVWATPSPLFPYVFEFSTTLPRTPAYVFGADFLVKIRACTRTQCSVLSSSTYLARWTCSDSVGGQQKPGPALPPSVGPDPVSGGASPAPPPPTPVLPPFEEPSCGGTTERICR